MAAYAALVSLMNNIEQIQRHTRLPITLDKNQMETLLEKVSFLIDFLESYTSHEEHEEMKVLESRIANAAYAAEDIIETHVVDRINAYSGSICTPRKRGNKLLAHAECLPGIEKVMEDMDFIEKEAMKVKEKQETDQQLGRPFTALLSNSIPVGMSTMVGFDEELIELLERLTGHQSGRQVIAIVGMGGMGKTTFANTAYENPLILQYFDCRAWVSISQKYSLRQTLLGLLGYESSQMDDEQLGENLYKSLCGRRYLVVLDDMWGVEAWEMVKVFLPNNNNSSRIIVTTRISSVATHLDSCGLEMSFLNVDKSWMLFCEKVFGQEGCPIELEEVGRKIVKNCQGLPLSIVVIGGHLANFEQTKEYWEYIAQDTKTIISSEANEICMRILSLSYHYLPIYLKPCFLYIGVFPEDKDISVSLLIKLWVAEGFLKPHSSKELKVVGDEYLNDLISRNLILVHKRGFTGNIKSCMIHDLLRDLCLKEAENEKFIYVPAMDSLDEVGEKASQRRITIPNCSDHFQGLYNEEPGSMCRSLICYDPKFNVRSQNIRLLRVLKGADMDFFSVTYSLEDAVQLVNSRFIAIDYIYDRAFPSSICLLWNLQILIVRGTSEEAIAPVEFWRIAELRYLQFEDRLYLPDPPPSQQMNGQEGDIVMKKLHTLKYIEDFRLSDEVVKRIPNIKKLNISFGLTRMKLEEQSLENIGLLENLESLTLLFRPETGSDLLSYLTFPNALKKFCLQGCCLHWEEMLIIGSLPHLEVLSLNRNAFIGPRWVLVEEGFRCLKYLRIFYCRDLVQWIAEDIPFPCLQDLHLGGLDKLVEIPLGFGDIPTLRKIGLHLCSNSAVISAKKILEEQENLGIASLQVRVYCRKDPVVESLASDNFLVKAW